MSILIELKWKYLLSSLSLGTYYCESILLFNENTWKKTLEATFSYAKNTSYSNENERLDLCCCSLHTCDSHKHIELNSNSEWNVKHCE